MPKKPIRVGFKVWSLSCSCCGYLCSFQVYSGKPTDSSGMKVTEKGLKKRVVTDLVEPFKGANHVVYMDNYYTSGPLIETLEKDKLYVVGTIQQNASGFPDTLKGVKPPKGTYVAQKVRNIRYFVFHDRKVVCFATNVFPEVMPDTIVRLQPDGKLRHQSVPPLLPAYNKFMGGVDRTGQIKKTYGYDRKSRRYWLRLFFYLLDVTHFIHAAPLSSANTNPIQKTVTAAEFHTLSPVTLDEISTIILAIDPKKSSGPSDINAKCLQLTLPSISSSITRILNLSLSTGSVPSCWKAANVTPVFKKGDKLNPSNYRPISVIPALGKILERVVYTRLMCHLSENNILTPYQSGFRPNHSTEDVLLRTVEDWRQEVDQGKAIAAVFIDFSKAFDSISHPLLLKKLQGIGINYMALNLFKDFLTNRQQRVVIDGQASSWSLVKQGVPQGSLLGPLLFSIYTNDMPSIISNSSINMYADDTALYASDVNTAVAAKRVTDDLSAIHKWCKSNCLLVNQSKTFAMFLSRNNSKQTSERSQTTVLFNGSPLQTVSEFRYLRVLLDSGLTFRNHINCFTSKAYGALSSLRKSQKHLPLVTRKLLYRSLVLPHLEYCPSVWDPSSKQLYDLIERVQNRAMRTILSRPNGTRSQPLRSELGWKTLFERRQLRKGVATYKIVNKLSPPYLHNIYK